MLLELEDVYGAGLGEFATLIRVFEKLCRLDLPIEVSVISHHDGERHRVNIPFC